MSGNNENNRPQVMYRLGAISQTGTYLPLVAHKKCRLKKASVHDTAVIAADGVNHYSFQLAVNGVLAGSPVLNSAGLAARAPLNLNLGSSGYLDLAKDDVVTLVVTEIGAGAVLTEASLAMDVQIVGN